MSDAIAPIKPVDFRLNYDPRQRRYVGLCVIMSDGTERLFPARITPLHLDNSPKPTLRLVDTKA